MTEFITNEARGDWRNLKGDHYHLVFLVWSQLFEGGQIAFYQGNDLHRISLPPEQVSTDEAGPPLILARPLDQEDMDEWIQLKSSAAPWGIGAVLRDLLFNFLHNALTSNSRGRNWRVRLASQGSIDGPNLKKFIADFEDETVFPRHKLEFAAIIDNIVERWNQENASARVQRDDVQKLAFDILLQLAEQEPFLLRVLQLECENFLLQLHPNRERVQGILNRAIGALLGDASAGPQQAHYYHIDWLEQASSDSLRPAGLFDRDPPAACREANSLSLPREWNHEYFTPRAELEAALHEFLAASESVFTLIGISGTGKSWTVAWMTVTLCSDRPCLLMSAGELELYRTIPDLVASRLRAFTSVQTSELDLLNRWKASAPPGVKPVVIVDDLLVTVTDARQLQIQLKRLCEQARQYGIKLILTSQEQIWRLNRLGHQIEPADVFSLAVRRDDFILLPPDASGEANPSVAESASDTTATTRSPTTNSTTTIGSPYDVQRGKWQQSSLKTERVSFVVEDFSADELEDAVRRRLAGFPPERARQVAYQLRSSAFAALRNPYLLDQYLSQNGAVLRRPGNPPPLNVDELLGWRTALALDKVAEEMGCHATDLEEGFNRLCAILWERRDPGVRREELISLLGMVDGSVFVTQLRQVGLLSSTSPIHLERTPIAERLFALEVARRVAAGGSFLEELRSEEDSGVVTAYLRHLAANSARPQTTSDALVRDELVEGELPDVASSGIVVQDVIAADYSLYDAVASDVVSVAEMLIQADRRWLPAVCEGLAQASPDDVRVVAFLTALIRPTSDEGMQRQEPCQALGRLAARGSAARRWLTAMYLSDWMDDRLNAATALGEMLELDPPRVRRLVSHRLERAARIDCFAFKGMERRRKWLRWALHPLRSPRHSEAARTAKQVASVYADLVDHCGSDRAPGQGLSPRRRMFDSQFDFAFARDLAELRGGVIAWDEDIRGQLFRDLESDDPKTRQLAAIAIRPASFEALDLVAAQLLERLRVEEDEVTLSRLLWASYGLTRPSYAPQFLSILREGSVSRWSDRLVCGPALVMLARLALRNPQMVLEMLPRSLDQLAPATAMYLHEVLVYAWWAVAGQSNRLPWPLQDEPWRQLERLAQLPAMPSETEFAESRPDGPRPARGEDAQGHEAEDSGAQGDGVISLLTERDAWPFLAKGVTLARLALLGRNRISALESQVHEMGYEWPYYFAELDQLIAKHAGFLASTAGSTNLIEALLAVVRAHALLPIMNLHTQDFEQDTFRRMGFPAARTCLTGLAHMLKTRPDPMPFVEQVPRTSSGDWQRIYLVRQLLQLGRRDEALLRTAYELCEILSRQQTANGGAEREQTLAVLAQVEGETTAAEDLGQVVQEYREQTRRSFWGRSERADGLARLTDERPERLLSVLDDSVREVPDLLMLFLWERETRDWRSLLMAKVFRRMFSSRLISPSEAKRLCHWMLAALAALPDTPLQRQWQTTYMNIFSVLDTRFMPGGAVNGEKTPLQNGHRQALWLLSQAVEEPVRGRSWFDARAESSHTLLTASTFSVNDGDVSYSLGHGAQTLFCYPAVRLAAVAIDGGRFDVDPVGRRMQRREQLTSFREKFGDFFHDPMRPQLQPERKDAVVAALEALLAEEENGTAPRDDEFRIMHLNVLLMADHPERAAQYAEGYIAEVETRPLTTLSTLHLLWYNLACARARLDDEAGCKDALEKAAEFQCLDGEHLVIDTDLATVRQCDWFQDLAAQYKPDRPRHEIRVELSPPAVVTDVKTGDGKFTASLDFSHCQVRLVSATL